MLRIKFSAGHSRCTDLHALLNNFEHRVSHTGFYALRVLLDIPVVHVWIKKKKNNNKYWHIDLHALLTNNFEHRVLRIEPINTPVHSTCRSTEFASINNRRREPGRDGNILSDRMLRIKGSAGHSRCTDLCALLNNFEHRIFCA